MGRRLVYGLSQDACRCRVSGRDPHRRYLDIIERYGTEKERSEAAVMREMLDAGEEIGGHWLPLTDVILPSVLLTSAEKVARRRHGLGRGKLATRWAAPRTLEDERRSASAQLAACIMLGLPFNHNMPPEQGRRQGNVGHGITVVCPKPENTGLIVEESKPGNRKMVLLYEIDPHRRYEWQGWMPAREAQKDEYMREFKREDADGAIVTSHPYIVPVEFLREPRGWKF